MAYQDRKVHEARKAPKEMLVRLENVVAKVIAVTRVSKVYRAWMPLVL